MFSREACKMNQKSIKAKSKGESTNKEGSLNVHCDLVTPPPLAYDF